MNWASTPSGSLPAIPRPRSISATTSPTTETSTPCTETSPTSITWLPRAGKIMSASSSILCRTTPPTSTRGFRIRSVLAPHRIATGTSGATAKRPASLPTTGQVPPQISKQCFSMSPQVREQNRTAVAPAPLCPLWFKLSLRNPRPRRLTLTASVPPLIQPTLQIRRQQEVKQLLPRFPPRRKPSRSVSPRLQPSLHRLANSQIFILHPVPYRHALLVISARRLAHVAEVEIENHPAMIHIHRDHQIRIQITL